MGYGCSLFEKYGVVLSQFSRVILLDNSRELNQIPIKLLRQDAQILRELVGGANSADSGQEETSSGSL